MLMIYGETRCPHCGRTLYAGDDSFVAEPRPGSDLIPGFRPGIYHEACFQGQDFADAYRVLKGAAQLAQLRTPAWRLLAEDERVALAKNQILPECRLLFIRRARLATLVGQAELRELALLAAGIDPQTPVSASGSRFELTSNGEQWLFSIREAVAGSMQLDSEDFRRLLRHLGLASAGLTRKHIDLARLCRELKLFPLSSSFSPDQSYGEVVAVESAPDSAAPVTLRLRVLKSIVIRLDSADLQSFRRVLAQAAS